MECDRARQQMMEALDGGLDLASYAPAIPAVAHLASGLTTLICTGDILLVRLGDSLNTVASSLWLTAGALMLPTMPLAFCGLFLALVANLLWLGLIRRLHPAKSNLSRR